MADKSEENVQKPYIYSWGSCWPLCSFCRVPCIYQWGINESLNYTIKQANKMHWRLLAGCSVAISNLVNKISILKLWAIYTLYAYELSVKHPSWRAACILLKANLIVQANYYRECFMPPPLLSYLNEEKTHSCWLGYELELIWDPITLAYINCKRNEHY